MPGSGANFASGSGVAGGIVRPTGPDPLDHRSGGVEPLAPRQRLTQAPPARVDARMQLYTPELLARLPDSALDGPVRTCVEREPDTDAPLAAALIERWVARYNPLVNVRKHLVGHNTDNFWTAFGELQVAAALDQLGFLIDMRHKLERPGDTPLTPDILASKGGQRLIVEVVSKANDKRTEEEYAKLRRIAADLQPRLNLPDSGFLSLTALAYGEIRPPGNETLDQVADQINRWLRVAAYGESFRLEVGPFPLTDTNGGRPT